MCCGKHLKKDGLELKRQSPENLRTGAHNLQQSPSVGLLEVVSQLNPGGFIQGLNPLCSDPPASPTKKPASNPHLFLDLCQVGGECCDHSNGASSVLRQFTVAPVLGLALACSGSGLSASSGAACPSSAGRTSSQKFARSGSSGSERATAVVCKVGGVPGAASRSITSSSRSESLLLLGNWTSTSDHTTLSLSSERTLDNFMPRDAR
mmetsp:Transcript_26708/g.47441  ORF Transcript_26708/g.47441 Transcript_26708/m.47441 type:complete len:207 (+) Transcript_26708:346-966(+)